MWLAFFNISDNSDAEEHFAEAVFSESVGDAYSSGINALKKDFIS
jgi:hypothetical protein